VRTPLALLAALVLAGCGGNGGGTDATGCRQVSAPGSKSDATRKKPTRELDPTRTYVLTVETSCGDFEITLDPKLAPQTTASLLALAESGYFDGTTFHRVVPGFVIQGGDPTGRGAGGPGYTTVDTPPADAAYTRGVVAMAKAPTEPPGTAGSQFFVVTAEDAKLPPDYAIVGEVTSGYDAVERIEALGDTQTQEPSQTVLVERVSAAES
jgi:cyclophilin family peptidyl-prolyl cis-trans isomerase